MKSRDKCHSESIYIYIIKYLFLMENKLLIWVVWVEEGVIYEKLISPQISYDFSKIINFIIKE